MTVFNGKAGTANWAAGGTSHVTNWTLNVTADVAEATAMGDTYKSRTVGFLDSSATVTAFVPAAGLDPAIATDIGTSAVLILDTVTGKEYTVTMILTDMSMNVDSDGNPTVTYSFIGNGTIVAEA